MGSWGERRKRREKHTQTAHGDLPRKGGWRMGLGEMACVCVCALCVVMKGFWVFFLCLFWGGGLGL